MSEYDSNKSIFRENAVPESNEQCDLGVVGRRWRAIRARDIIGDTLTFISLVISTLTVNTLTVVTSAVFTTAATFSFLAGGGTRYVKTDNAGNMSGQVAPIPVGDGGTGTTTAFTAGSVVFAGASGVYAQNNSKLFWDNTGFNFLFNGGTIGASGVGVFGLGVGTAPTTSPASTLQFWAQNRSGAGTAEFAFRDEKGAVYEFGSSASNSLIRASYNAHVIEHVVFSAGGIWMGSQSNDTVSLVANDNPVLNITPAQNVGLSTSTFGASAVNVFAVATGTAPTSFPAGEAQLWTQLTQAVAGRTAFHFASEDGMVKPVDPVIFRAVGNPIKDIVNTTTETTLFSSAPTLKGGTLGTNRMLRITVYGDVLNNAASPAGFTLRIKYGGTTVLTLIQSQNANATRRAWSVTAMIAAAGATNAQTGAGQMWQPGGTGVSGGDSPITTVGDWRTSLNNAVAVDSTADQTLDITAQNSTASASMSTRPFAILVELV